MGGKIYCGEIKFANAKLPYFISDRVDQKPMYWFDKDGENYLWRFKIYDKSKLKLEQYESQLFSLFDDCELSVSGYHTMRMERRSTMTLREQTVWVSITTYSIKIDRS